MKIENLYFFLQIEDFIKIRRKPLKINEKKRLDEDSSKNTKANPRKGEEKAFNEVKS